MRKRTLIWITVCIASFAAYFAFPRGGTTHPKTSEAADRSAGAAALPSAASGGPSATGGQAGLAGRMHGRTDAKATGRVSGAVKPVPTKHLALNSSQADWAKLTSLGYNVFDVAPQEDQINSLPRGGEAMLWVGAYSCDGTYQVSYDAFTDLVDKLGRNPKVYGWYLADEPDPKACPAVVSEIRKRADYINEHAPDQLAFISATDYDYRPLRPQNTHVDLIGLDPYPCFGQTRHCDMGEIDRLVNGALAGGIPLDVIVPVFQTFGQECSRGMKATWLPTEAELRQILARWRALVPEPVFDISYSWGRQEQWACPTLSEANGTGGQPDLQAIMKAHNHSSTAPAPGGGQGTTSPRPPTPCTPVKAEATPQSRR